MRPDTKNWIDSALYDLETAKHMLTTRRYLYVVFMCHLALEKMLKAHVTENLQTIPPRTHDLIYLVSRSALTLPDAYLEFLGKINNASTLIRYPDDFQQALQEYPRSVVKSYLQQTEEIIEWLRQVWN
ncbi:MAG: HEPN domain-containing protein [Anaerolineae bacterium]